MYSSHCTSSPWPRMGIFIVITEKRVEVFVSADYPNCMERRKVVAPVLLGGRPEGLAHAGALEVGLGTSLHELAVLPRTVAAAISTSACAVATAMRLSLAPASCMRLTIAVSEQKLRELLRRVHIVRPYATIWIAPIRHGVDDFSRHWLPMPCGGSTSLSSRIPACSPDG